MKNWAFWNKFVLILGLVLAGQGFAIDNWEDFAKEPQVQRIDGKDFRLIYTAEELAWVAKNTDHPESQGNIPNVKLMADIDLGGKLWTPICAGKGTPKFNAIFDGNGFTVSNLYIKGSELLEIHNDSPVYIQNIGFIGVLGSGTVKNLTMNDVNILATNDDGTNPGTNEISVGGLVGWKDESASGTIDGVSVSGTITVSGKGQGIGGIVGNAKAGTIKNSISTVSIYASGNKSYIGGVVGLTKADLKVESCVYAGENLVNTGKDGAVGAVVGDHRSGTLTTTNTYYDSDLFDAGVGKGTITSTNSVEELNSEEVICALNNGNLDDNGECDKQEPWSVGLSGISLNGSDGFKVTFNANGGAFAAGAKTSIIVPFGGNVPVEEITKPTREEYVFAGWSLDKAAEEPAFDLGTVTGVTTVYAVWNPVFTVSFDANGGTFPDGSLIKEKKVASNEPITVEGIAPLPVSYCKENGEIDCDVTMFFTGWSFSNEADEDAVVDLNTLDVFATEDVTLYAVWTEEETYTVTFHAEGHGKTTVDFIRVKEGNTIDKPTAPSADVGYTFVDWFTEDGEVFDFENTKITKSIVLSAQWMPTEYNIYYSLDGGSNASSNKVSYNIESETIVFASPTKEGNDFVGWYYDEGFTKPATQITQGTTGDKNLYAKWSTKTYTITYLSGSLVAGTAIADSKKYGETVYLKDAVGAFACDGYKQTGWSRTDGGEMAFAVGAEYRDDADIILYPYWSKEPVVTTYGGVTIYEYEDGHKEAVIDATSKETIPTITDVQVTAVTFNRDFAAGARSTIVLPFSISVSRVQGGTFYEIARMIKTDGKWTVGVRALDDNATLNANTPYIVVANTSNLTFDVSSESPVTLNTSTMNDVSIDVYESADAATPIEENAWTFKGTYQYWVFGDMDEFGRAYGFSAEAKENLSIGSFVRGGAGATIRPLRAYLVYEGGQSSSKTASLNHASAFTQLPDEVEIVVLDEQNNVIERGVMNTVTGQVRMDRWYDLQGRRLKGEPKTQGTYYHNGKRVIVK